MSLDAYHDYRVRSIDKEKRDNSEDSINSGERGTYKPYEDDQDQRDNRYPDSDSGSYVGDIDKLDNGKNGSYVGDSDKLDSGKNKASGDKKSTGRT